MRREPRRKTNRSSRCTAATSGRARAGAGGGAYRARPLDPGGAPATGRRQYAPRHTESLPFAHKVVFRQTNFGSTKQPDDRARIQELYGLIAQDEQRNDMIFDDVLRALEAGRSRVVITERKDHLQMLADRLAWRYESPSTACGRSVAARCRRR